MKKIVITLILLCAIQTALASSVATTRPFTLGVGESFGDDCGAYPGIEYPHCGKITLIDVDDSGGTLRAMFTWHNQSTPFLRVGQTYVFPATGQSVTVEGLITNVRESRALVSLNVSPAPCSDREDESSCETATYCLWDTRTYACADVGYCVKDGNVAILGLKSSIVGFSLSGESRVRTQEEDVCLTPNILDEKLCGEDNYIDSQTYFCPYGCEDGRCLNVKGLGGCAAACLRPSNGDEGWYDCEGNFVEEAECPSDAGRGPVELPEETPGNASLCDGCLVEGRCLPYGLRTNATGFPAYCSINRSLVIQREEDAACENDYECLSNSCLSGACTDLSRELQETRGLLERIMNWLRRMFPGFGG